MKNYITETEVKENTLKSGSDNETSAGPIIDKTIAMFLPLCLPLASLDFNDVKTKIRYLLETLSECDVLKTFTGTCSLLARPLKLTQQLKTRTGAFTGAFLGDVMLLYPTTQQGVLLISSKNFIGLLDNFDHYVTV